MATTNIDGYDLKGIETGGFINEDVMQKIWDFSKIPQSEIKRQTEFLMRLYDLSTMPLSEHLALMRRNDAW